MQRGGDLPRAVAPKEADGLASHALWPQPDSNAVRLTNEAGDPTAVTLSVGGLSLFDFSEPRVYCFVVAPPKQAVVLS